MAGSASVVLVHSTAAASGRRLFVARGLHCHLESTEFALINSIVGRSMKG